MRIWKTRNTDNNRYTWHVDFTIKGKRHRDIKAATKEELDDLIEALRKRARAEHFGLDIEQAPITIKELVSEREKDFDLSIKAHRSYLKTLERFRDHFPVGTLVHILKTAHLRDFARAFKAERHIQPGTMNVYWNYINSMLHRACEYYPELENWKPPRIPFEKVEQKGRERVITEEEQARLFFVLRAPAGGLVGEKRPRREKPEETRTRHTVADLFEMGLMTGTRPTEIRTLKWSRIDWAIRHYGEVTVYGEIDLSKTKTEKRKVPINRDLRAILDAKRAHSTSEYIFANATTGQAVLSETVVRQVLKRAAKKAGVPYGHNMDNGFVFHDARHTAVTNMLHNGADLKTIGSIVGHSDETMTLHYSHASGKSRAGAVASLNKRGSEIEQGGEKSAEEFE